MKAMLRSHLDCQGGLSVPETRPELAYALSENPQNTLAKSKAMLSMCPKSNHLLEFFQCHLVFSSIIFCTNISIFFSICPNLLPGNVSLSSRAV